MAYEIWINQDYQFVDNNCSAPYNTLFWSLLEKEVTSTPPDYTRVIKVVYEICFNLREVNAICG